MKIKAKESFKKIRTVKGFSITGLAKAMQVSSSVVFNMEAGRSVRPATAKKACKVLEEGFETLFIIND